MTHSERECENARVGRHTKDDERKTNLSSGYRMYTYTHTDAHTPIEIATYNHYRLCNTYRVYE
jgi:hypothetical protein